MFRLRNRENEKYYAPIERQQRSLFGMILFSIYTPFSMFHFLVLWKNADLFLVRATHLWSHGSGAGCLVSAAQQCSPSEYNSFNSITTKINNLNLKKIFIKNYKISHLRNFYAQFFYISKLQIFFAIQIVKIIWLNRQTYSVIKIVWFCLYEYRKRYIRDIENTEAGSYKDLSPILDIVSRPFLFPNSYTIW